jgi:hypothetical protein
MRWFVVVILVVLSVAVGGGYLLLQGLPYKLYSRWITGQGGNRYYVIDGFRKEWLRPVALAEVPPYAEDYGQLWKEFSLVNIRMPLPVRHPLFQTVPYLASDGPKSRPRLGIILLNPAGRELSRVYTLPFTLLKDHTLGQELFKLPYVRNRILKLAPAALWKDIFSRAIEVRPKPIDEMIYDLYLMHLRAKILPRTTVRYGLLKDERAIVELHSENRDYRNELVLTNHGGTVFSYLLRTELNNDESLKLRAKFLDSISFAPVDEAMAKFLYTEFKQLNFARQVDQEGMLYLFAAWSQDPENTDLFRELIFYLERGRKNAAQLRPLYAFGVRHYGKTFTATPVAGGGDDPEIALQRKIELEKIEAANRAERIKDAPAPRPELSPDEKMNLYLKRAKEAGPAASDEMKVY